MTLTSTVRVGGLASSSVRAQVAGAPRVATVLHAGRNAAYLDLGGSCIAVLAERAVHVPCGVHTSLPVLPEVRSGEAVVVSDGSILLNGCEVVVATTVDATAPALGAAAAGWAAARLAPHLDPSLQPTRAALPGEALSRLAAGDPRSATALLGLGAGLTPLGDDVLCGWLATAVSLRHPALGPLRDEVAVHAPLRTTTLSATLLACASRGEVVPEFRSLLDAVNRKDWTTVQRSAELVLRVGQSSGAGLLLGTTLALEVPR